MAKIGGKKYDIEYIVGTDDQTKVGLESAEKQMQDVAKTNKSITDRMKSQWLTLDKAIGATAGYLAIKKAIELTGRVFVEFEKAAQRQQAGIVFKNLARSVNTSSIQIISDLRKASGDMISFDETIAQAGRSILLGLQPDTITQLMRIARSSAKVTGQTIEQAFGDITMGVARQSKMILDNLGILVDYDKHLKKMATSLGTTEEKLSDTDRRQAFLNATMEAGEVIIARVGSSYDTLYEKIQKYKATITDIKIGALDNLFGIKAAAVAGGQYGRLVDEYGQVQESLNELMPRYQELLQVIEEVRAGTRDPQMFLFTDFTNDVNSILGRVGSDAFKSFEQAEMAIIGMQKRQNEIRGDFGLPPEVEEQKQTETLFPTPPDPSEMFKVNGVDLSELVDREYQKIYGEMETASEKAYKEMYGRLEVKTKDWVAAEIAELQKLRDYWALFDEELADQLFAEGQKKILEEFIESRLKTDETKAYTAGQEMGIAFGNGVANAMGNTISDALYGIFTGDGLEIENLLESFGRMIARTIADSIADAAAGAMASFWKTMITNMVVSGATSAAGSGAGAAASSGGGGGTTGGQMGGGSFAQRTAPDSNRITINNYIYEDAMLEKKVNNVVSKAIRNNSAISKQMRNN